MVMGSGSQSKVTPVPFKVTEKGLFGGQIGNSYNYGKKGVVNCS